MDLVILLWCVMAATKNEKQLLSNVRINQDRSIFLDWSPWTAVQLKTFKFMFIPAIGFCR